MTGFVGVPGAVHIGASEPYTQTHTPGRDAVQRTWTCRFLGGVTGVERVNIP